MAGKVSVENDGSLEQESAKNEVNTVVDDQQTTIVNGNHEVDSGESVILQKLCKKFMIRSSPHYNLVHLGIAGLNVTC